MWWIVSLIYSFMYNSLVEFTFFVLVDIVAKSSLREATSDNEKKSIWYIESLVLSAICLLVYLGDHCPYILMCFTAITFVYAHMYGRVDFRYWWIQIQTWWDEHELHVESMNEFKQQINRQKQPRNPPTYQHVSNVSTPVSATNDHLVSSVYKNPVNERTQGSWFVNTGRPVKLLNLGQKEQIYDTRKTLPYHQNTLTNRGSENPYYSQMARRPLRPDGMRLVPSVSAHHSPVTSIKTKFMSVLGINTGPNLKPPGLRNNGLNVCFMNSVVQALARSPRLVSCLTTDVSKDRECGLTESLLLTTLVELLHQLNLPAGSSGVGVLDPTAFRQAASTLNSELVAPLGQQQDQQDAAEFLMWLLETVHNILNKNQKALQNDSNGRNQERFTSPSLSMLRFIYGDLNAAKIRELKSACRKEIDLARGLENDSYAEPIQRLSDLEWLTHKQENETIIDDLFTGQLVEAYHCLTDSHISVNLQAFNILPVPIAAPREVSGIVYLEDCFTSFCHIEHLFGQEGLDGSWCEAMTKTKDKKGSKSVKFLDTKLPLTPISNPSGFSSPDAASNAFMSPILGNREFINDSGFHDSIYKTSTPIFENRMAGLVTPRRKMKDIQRRSLLRQLPECLAVQLMRFAYNQRTRRSKKMKAPVSIPLMNLNLTNIIYDTVTRREDLTASGSYSYDLYSLCVHLGAESTNHGHYVNYSLCDGKWFRFDDENVTEVNMEYEITTKEIRENAYIVFYKRGDRS